MGDVTRGEEATVLALKTSRSNDERMWPGNYDNSLRSSTLMLSLLEKNKLLPDEQYSLLNILLQQAFGKHWLSTQESNTLFLTARTLQDLSGKWQAQVTFSVEPLIDEKAQTSNLDNDQFTILQVTNNGDQPSRLHVDTSGYPQPTPLPTSNVL